MKYNPTINTYKIPKKLNNSRLSNAERCSWFLPQWSGGLLHTARVPADIRNPALRTGRPENRHSSCRSPKQRLKDCQRPAVAKRPLPTLPVCSSARMYFGSAHRERPREPPLKYEPARQMITYNKARVGFFTPRVAYGDAAAENMKGLPTHPKTGKAASPPRCWWTSVWCRGGRVIVIGKPSPGRSPPASWCTPAAQTRRRPQGQRRGP